MGTLFYSKKLKHIIKAWPGSQYFGIYRFLPFFFAFGAVLEFAMIKWEVNEGQVNFYKTFKRSQASALAEEKFNKLTKGKFEEKK